MCVVLGMPSFAAMYGALCVLSAAYNTAISMALITGLRPCSVYELMVRDRTWIRYREQYMLLC